MPPAPAVLGNGVGGGLTDEVVAGGDVSMAPTCARVHGHRSILTGARTLSMSVWSECAASVRSLKSSGHGSDSNTVGDASVGWAHRLYHTIRVITHEALARRIARGVCDAGACKAVWVGGCKAVWGWVGVTRRACKGVSSRVRCAHAPACCAIRGCKVCDSRPRSWQVATRRAARPSLCLASLLSLHLRRHPRHTAPACAMQSWHAALVARGRFGRAASFSSEVEERSRCDDGLARMS